MFLQTLNIGWGQIDPKDNRRVKYTGKQDNKGAWLIRNTWEQLTRHMANRESHDRQEQGTKHKTQTVTLREAMTFLVQSLLFPHHHLTNTTVGGAKVAMMK